MEKTAKKYLSENFGSDEEKPLNLPHKIIRINAAVSALQFSAPEDGEDAAAKPAVFTSFFGGKSGCDFLLQSDGVIAEILDTGAAQYIFVRQETDEAEQRQTDDQVLTVTASGDVQPTRDQHGNEIFFSQTIQKRCDGKAGDAILWSRDSEDSRRITVRQRHTERDARCRVIEDSSSYRYYRLTANAWELDESEEDAFAEQIETTSAAEQKRRRY